MKIAITGGIAEGKSTVVAFLSQLGASVASADEIAREVMQEPRVVLELEACFGAELLGDRERFRREVLQRPEARRKLNKIVHPSVAGRIEQIPSGYVEVPLLYEARLQHLFDAVWVVTCGPEEQARRLTARYGETADLKALRGWQLPTLSKIRIADVVIRTDTTFEIVQNSTEQAHRGLFSR
jgi:dephospho-CoA kinase